MNKSSGSGGVGGGNLEERKAWNRNMIVMLVVLIVFGVFGFTQFIAETAPPPLYVVLFGDSLIGNTDDNYHLAHVVQDILNSKQSYYSVVVTPSGVGGNCVKDLLDRVETDLLFRKHNWLPTSTQDPPTMTIIYWDSDATDIDETSHVEEIRQAYRNNLKTLLQTVTTHIPFVALGGPTLYGELPRGTNSRDDILEAYREINQNVTRQFGVKYLETRNLFYQHLPANWNQHSGFLTVDGEHHNQQGADLIIALFADVLLDFIHQKIKSDSSSAKTTTTITTR